MGDRAAGRAARDVLSRGMDPRRPSSRLAPLLAVLALLAGCRDSVDIARDASLEGTRRVRTFVVRAGATLTAPSSLRVIALDDIIIEGTIRGAEDSGAEIVLESLRGSVWVIGGVEAGGGRDGDAVDLSPIAVGGAGGPGGDVTLRARRGEVLVRGEIFAGDGGGGGTATATGGAGSVYAEGGVPAGGGSVTIEARGRIEVTAGASVEAGSGGSSGSADASVEDGPGAAAEEPPEEVAPPGEGPLPPGEGPLPPGEEPPEEAPPGEEPAGGPEEPPVAAVQAAVTARTPDGGPGGKVTVTILSDTAEVLVQSELEAGDGGEVGAAMATGGTTARATAGRGGRGGDVFLDVEILRLRLFDFPSPGDGGSSGVPAAPAQAFAEAAVTATARVGGGGDPGIWLERGNVRYSSGTGGSAGNARARGGGVLRVAPGQAVVAEETPAGPVEARAP